MVCCIENFNCCKRTICTILYLYYAAIINDGIFFTHEKGYTTIRNICKLQIRVREVIPCSAKVSGFFSGFSSTVGRAKIDKHQTVSLNFLAYKAVF